MKKFIIATASILAVVGTANAELRPLTPSKAFDNMSVTVKGGMASPLNPQRGSMGSNFRGMAGMEFRKQLTPNFGIGAEGEMFFNSSTWNKMPSMHNVIDKTYIGIFGAFNMMNVIGGYSGSPRTVEVELVSGLGWLHGFVPKSQGHDSNDIGLKSGMNINFNLGADKAWTLSLKPGIIWNVTNDNKNIVDSRTAIMEIAAGVTYHFGNSNDTHSFTFYDCDFSEYNDQINEMRGLLAQCSEANFMLENANAVLAEQLAECQNQPATVVTNTVVEENNTLESVRYVFFRIGSSKVAADQQPNVEMIADYMKNNPESTVEIKGYASKDGNLDFNIRLAKARAESVKNMLVKGYGIKADRIHADGQGIGEMFKEDSWNRVSICVLND